jgi:hypothetical protein
MASEEFDWQELNSSDLIEGITAVLLAPVVLPIAAGMNQPMAKKTIKDAIAFSQRCKEAVAQAGERFEDLLAEAQAELDEEAQTQADEPPLRRTEVEYPASSSLETSEIAGTLIDWVSEVNTQAQWLTNGYADLRLLMPLGFGALALRQLWEKGLELDEIPWYNLAWYAFDSFNKLNHPRYQRPLPPPAAPPSSHPEAEPRSMTKPEDEEIKTRESE